LRRLRGEDWRSLGAVRRFVTPRVKRRYLRLLELQWVEDETKHARNEQERNHLRFLALLRRRMSVHINF